MCEQHVGTVELHVIEQPGVQPRQGGQRLDSMMAPPCEQTHPPAAGLLAEHKCPSGLDKTVAGSIHAPPLSASCNADVSELCRYFDGRSTEQPTDGSFDPCSRASPSQSIRAHERVPAK